LVEVNMAQHRARSRVASALLALMLAIGTSTVALVVGQGSASAGLVGPTSPGKSVAPSNANVKGKCSFTVQSVNPSDGTVVAKVSAQAQPATLNGYLINAYTQMYCSVYSPFGSLLTAWNPFVNGPILGATGETLALPFYSSYILCGQGFVKLNSGANSLTPFICA
jgi:hypothetical protein